MLESNEHYQPLILIVDDIPKNLQILGSILNLESYQIAFASSGEQALAVLETAQPDIILLDIMMPDMDGMEVCARIKANPEICDIPIIFITGRAEQEDIVKGLKLGAVDYITKPFNTPELLTRVKTHLELKLSKDKLKLYAKTLEHTRDELAQLNASKDKFFSIIAHDLRSPFSGFLGLTQLLLDDYSRLEGDDLQQIANSMNKAANKLYGFLENLLEWSRSQMGKMELRFDRFDIKEALNRIEFLFSDTLLEKKITIHNNLTEKVIVFADNHTLSTALRNIISNAVKFTPIGGTIEFNIIEQTADTIVFEIKDSGEGIPAHQIPKLFQIESKIVTTGTANEKGSGLGLLLVKEFIDKNNGNIQLISEIGKGTSAILTLPLAKI